MKSERWVKVLGGVYEVSSLGRIRRLKRASGTTPGRILRPGVDPRGYLHVTLSEHSELHQFWVHQLVARAFLGPCPKGKNVNHKDGVKSNNAVSNLEYVTFSKNTRHALESGLIARDGLGRFANGL